MAFVSCRCIVVVLALVGANGARLTLHHIPASWGSRPTISIHSETDADDAPHWTHCFAAGDDFFIDVDLDPFRLLDHVRVHLDPTPARIGCCARHSHVSASVRVPIRRLLTSDAFHFETEDNRIVVDAAGRPTRVEICHQEGHVGCGTTFAKKVAILTLGTRGDFQPFLAVAILLAEQRNYHVILCTESGFQSQVEQYDDRLERGRIDFVAAGGDTSARLRFPLLQGVVSHPSVVVQAACVAFADVEFSGVEPVVYDCMRRLRLDALLYGFNVVSVAATVSEALGIPAIAMYLQLLALPSRHYAPIIELPDRNAADCTSPSAVTFDLVRALRATFAASKLQRIRRRRNLPWHHSDPYDYVLAQTASPIIVPMDECAFGVRPSDWPASVQLTGFIYMRDGTEHLPAELTAFLDAPDQAGFIVAVSFSSMIVDNLDLYHALVAIATESKSCPRLILIGGDHDAVMRDNAVADLARRGRFLHVRQVPFSLIFGRVDAAVIHGGIGTTSEVLLAGIPVLVTGTLLMDQRFWGQRLHELSVGPPMTPFDEFVENGAAVMDRFLGGYEQYRKAARQVASGLRRDGDVAAADAIADAIETARPMTMVPGSSRPRSWGVTLQWMLYWPQLGAALLSRTLVRMIRRCAP